jgi:hypothetical protein
MNPKTRKGLWFVVFGCLSIAVGAGLATRGDAISIGCAVALFLSGAFSLFAAWKSQ